jgi:hypothetical protein
MKHLVLMALVAVFVCASGQAQEQQCPGTDPLVTNFCRDQYNTCWSDNEGKNCDYNTCQAYCDNQYDECLYGVRTLDHWENPVISRTIDYTHSTDGCVSGCTASGCWCVSNWVNYREYYTHWQAVEKDHRTCDDGYEYDEIVQTEDHPDDVCYQHDDSCASFEEVCIEGSYCQFSDDGSSIVVHN